jgi:hypothetical protein
MSQFSAKQTTGFNSINILLCTFASCMFIDVSFCQALGSRIVVLSMISILLVRQSHSLVKFTQNRANEVTYGERAKMSPRQQSRFRSSHVQDDPALFLGGLGLTFR